MKMKFIKAAVISACTLAFVAVPATQTFAWGCGCSYGYGGYGSYSGQSNYSNQSYYQPSNQQRTTTSYTPQQTTPIVSKSAANKFDPTVFEIQLVLSEQGYYEDKVDGLLGKNTEIALLQFQEDNDIKKTKGVKVKELKADKVTLKALGL